MAKVAFYHGHGDNLFHRFLHFLVFIWTSGKYTHVEFIDDREDPENPEKWKWYSASSLTEKKVRMKVVDFHPDHWDVYVLRDINTDSMVDFFEQELGKHYDWLGIMFSQFIPLRISNKNKWFCSEIIVKALQVSKCLPENIIPERTSPIKLYKYLQRLYKINKLWTPDATNN